MNEEYYTAHVDFKNLLMTAYLLFELGNTKKGGEVLDRIGWLFGLKTHEVTEVWITYCFIVNDHYAKVVDSLRNE